MKIASWLRDEDFVPPVLECKDKSLTQQSSAAECDINKIVARFDRTGSITHVSDKVGRYGDFSTVGDYHAAMNVIAKSNDVFMELPVDVRERFDNDPAKMLAFLEDPQNRKEAVSLGLVEEKKQEGVESPVTGPEAPVVAPTGA